MPATNPSFLALTGRRRKKKAKATPATTATATTTGTIINVTFLGAPPDGVVPVGATVLGFVSATVRKLLGIQRKKGNVREEFENRSGV